MTPSLPERSISTIPVPDPTELTTKALLREVDALKELLGQRMESLEGRINRLYADQERQPAEINLRIKHLSDLTEERFLSVKSQFQNSKIAVETALAASKESFGQQNVAASQAILKSEMNTIKQIDQLVLLNRTTSESLSEKIEDLKSRLNRFEGRDLGNTGAAAVTRTNLAIILSIVSFALLFVSVMFNLFSTK